MSRGGAGPGWGWWPPSRRRRLPRPGRRRAGGALLTAEAERSLPDWALPLAAAGSALLLLVAVLSGLAAALGLCGTALALAGAAAAGGGAWAAAAAAAAGGGGRERRGAPPPGKKALMPPPPAPALAAACNGGPAASCASAGPEGRRRRICGDHLTSPVHFMLPPRRRYPIQQAQYASLGTLPSICWDGYGRKSRLSAHNSGMVQSPVTVKIARPDSNFGHSPLLEHLSSPAAFSPTPNSILDPCAKETVLSALRESRKRVVEEEEEDRSFLSSQEIKRRRHDSGGSGQSAFEPLVANGAPASLVPKPGSLKRGLLPSHGLEDSSSKRSRTSSLSSVNSLSVGGIPSSIRNAIASSYSSTRGLSQLWKRSGLSGSPLSSPASSRSQTPERPNKKARYPNSSLLEEDSHKTGASTPLKADKEVQAEKDAETPLQSRPSPQASLSSSGSDGKRKRKIQLLSTRRGDHFTLPPPPQLGFPVTSEDLEAEKVAALQRFNKVLEDKTDSASSPPAEAAAASASSSLPSSLSFPLAQPAKPPTTAPEANPLLESLKKMQEGQSTSGQPDPGTVASTSSRETPQLPATSASLSLGSLAPVTSAEGAAKPLLLSSPPSVTGTAAPPLPPLPPPASSAAQPASEGSSLVNLSSSSAELSQTPARPSSSLPKPSILFGILTSPPGGQSLAGALAAPPATVTAAASVPSATAAATTAPLFKPIFGTPAKSESLTLSSAGSTSGTFSVAPPGTLSSGAPPSLDSSPGTFKRVFGGLPTPATTAAAASSLFAFQPASAPGPPASTTTTTTAAGLSVLGFPAPSEGTGISTLASLLSTASGVTTVSASKPLFTFGLGSQTSTLGISGGSLAAPAVAVPPGTATSTSLPSQPLLFGAPSATTTATSTASAPLFQFGKLASAQSPSLSPSAGSAFSQAASGTAQAAPTSTSAAGAPTGFNVFGGGSGSSTRARTAPSAAATTTMPATAATTASQPSLTFGSGPFAFGGGLGAASKAPPPPYTAEPNQPTFEAGPPEGQQAATKPAPGPMSFGTPFGFTGSVVQPAVQPAFGTGANSSASQPTFGGPGPLASFGAKSSSQPAFGATASVFSFGGASAAAGGGFGSNTQTTASSSGGGTGGTSVFGGPAPAPFGFGASSQPVTAAAGGGGGSAFALGAGAGAAGTGVPSVSFSFGSGQSGAAGAATPFGSSSLAPNPLGTPAQTSAFAFSIPSAPESKLAFGGAPAPTFGQSTPAAAAAAGGATLGPSTLSFGSSITPAFGGTGPTFGPSAPTFSIGAGSKTGARQRLQARRQHTRKK